MNVTIVVGNPKARSRTYQAANSVAEKLTDRPADLVVDLADLGAALLDWSSIEVADLVDSVVSSSMVIFASPTFKGTYTGLLKLFLDRIGTGSLAGKPAVAFMVGATLRHALAPEVFLRPVLVELGASCPAPGLFVLESEYKGSATLDDWAQRARPLLAPWAMVPQA
jgi:FMN reductase